MKITKVIVDRQFSTGYINAKIKSTKHNFIIGGKNNEREKLALAIAESATTLAYQPRKWAKKTMEKMKITKKNYALITRRRLDYRKDIYIVNSSGSVEGIAYGVTHHRACVIVNQYDNRDQYDKDIWQNYITNGYNTRIGLRRAQACEAKIKRIKQIAKSHADYNEFTYDGALGHALRVRTRN